MIKKIRKKHPKYMSKIQFWNLRTEGEAHIGSLANRVTREFNALFLDEVILEDCENCGHKNVIKSRLIALGMVSAATNQGTRTHPVVDNMLKGYLCTEEGGGQIELKKLIAAAEKYETLNASKKKSVVGKVNAITKSNGNKQQKTITNKISNENRNKEQTKRYSRAFTKYEPGLRLDQLKCRHCQNSGHKSFNCPIKKEGC